jgi:hypothetical protein
VLSLSQELPSQKRPEFSVGTPTAWRPAPVVPRIGAACAGDAIRVAVRARLATATGGENLIMWFLFECGSMFVVTSAHRRTD